METQHSREPPVVLPPLTPSDNRSGPKGQRWHDAGEWLERVLGAESYGAPRVFDLFTLLAITLAFALLLAALRLLSPLVRGELDAVAIILGAFVTGIALFQMLLWGGKKPRLASLVAGPILWFLTIAAFSLGQPASLLSPIWRIAVGCSSVFGLPAGYLGGAMVAGVFLIADFFRTKYLRPRLEHENDNENDDQIFAEAPQPPASHDEASP